MSESRQCRLRHQNVALSSKLKTAGHSSGPYYLKGGTAQAYLQSGVKRKQGALIQGEVLFYRIFDLFLAKILKKYQTPRNFLPYLLCHIFRVPGLTRFPKSACKLLIMRMAPPLGVGGSLLRRGVIIPFT